MATINDVKNVFGLNDYYEMPILQRCIQNFSQNLTTSSLLPKAWNVAKSIFGSSDWQESKKILKNHAMAVIRSHFHSHADDSTLEPRAQALSEFLLNYLITRQSYANDQRQFLIPQSEWINNKMDSLSLPEIIDRASFGNGKSLPLLDRQVLIKLLKHERAACIKEVKEFDSYLKHDPAIQKLNQLRLMVLRLSSHHLSTKASEKEPDPLQQAAEVVKKMQTSIHNLAAVDNEQQLSTIDTAIINESLQSFRQQRQLFINIAATLRSPAPGFW